MPIQPAIIVFLPLAPIPPAGAAPGPVEPIAIADIAGIVKVERVAMEERDSTVVTEVARSETKARM